MSIKLQKQIDLLIEEKNKSNQRIFELERKNVWIIEQLKSGMLDILERVIKQNLEIDVVEQDLTNDQKLTILLNEENMK